ncbi:hypothetical protein EIP86_010712, partial [Pleurotus ostreatoroseus]
NVFWDVPHMNPHLSICFDRLHFNAGGEFGGHLWKELQFAVEDTKRHVRSAIDHQYDIFPRWRNLNHFGKVLHTEFSDGSKYEDIAKCLSFAAHDALTEDVSPLGYLLLRCIRAYVEHDMYLSFEVHTEDTIALGRAALIRMELLMEYYSKCNPEKQFKTPKRHYQDHAYDGILKHGVTRGYGTKPFEQLHGPIKNAYHEQTNFKDVGRQLMRIDHDTLTCKIIRANVDIYEKHRKDLEDEEDEKEDTQNAPSSGPIRTLSFGRLYLGSCDRPTTYRKLEAAHKHDLAYRWFHTRLARFLSSTFPHANGKDWVIKLDDKIQEFKYVKVDFESKITWRTETDYLRCNPQFYGRPRFDGVLVQGEDKMFFGILISVFAFTLSDGNLHPFALIQPLDIPEGPLSRKDKHLHLYRLRSALRRHSIFIHLDTIIRGALLVPDPSEKGDFFVMDVIDADWFMRCREIFRGVINWSY